jgi:hypothetical protein
VSNHSNDRTSRRTNGHADRRGSLERFPILNGFVDLGMAGPSRSEIAVWLILFRDSKPNGLARTSLSDLARRGGMSERQATRALRALLGRGAIYVIRKGVLGRATDYSLYAPDLLAQICPELRPWL